jgi:hypothetical protein
VLDSANVKKNVLKTWFVASDWNLDKLWERFADDDEAPRGVLSSAFSGATAID